MIFLSRNLCAEWNTVVCATDACGSAHAGVQTVWKAVDVEAVGSLHVHWRFQNQADGRAGARQRALVAAGLECFGPETAPRHDADKFHVTTKEKYLVLLQDTNLSVRAIPC